MNFMLNGVTGSQLIGGRWIASRGEACSAVNPADGKALATKLAITPDSSKSDVTDLTKNVSDDVKDLNDKKAGKEWDEDYIGKQVDAHQMVLDKLQDASKSAQNAQLKDALMQSIGKVQEHLTKAKELKDSKAVS